jgi:4'-phosphopantetheinyl transferase
MIRPVHQPIEFDPADGARGVLPSWPVGIPALWIVDAVRHGDAAERLAPGILDDGEQQRAGRFVAPADRRCYVTAHVALRMLLGARLGVEPREVRLVREPCPSCGGPHGRPATDGGLHFSLSHSRDLSLLAFAAAPVGVDVEAVPNGTAAASVGAMLHPAEVKELAELRAEDRPVAFARAWTRKDLGTGPVPAPGPPGWTVTDVLVPAGYAAAVAVCTAGQPPVHVGHRGN